jgi:hypothetical protein
MNNQDIENMLSACRVKGLTLAARTRILAVARAAWRETTAAQPIWTWNYWRWPVWTASAAAIMIFINIIAVDLDRTLTDQLIADSIPFQKIKQTMMAQSCLASGRNPYDLRPIINAALCSPAPTRPAEWQDIFLKQLALKQYIGLSQNGG